MFSDLPDSDWSDFDLLSVSRESMVNLGCSENVDWQGEVGKEG